mmetsp:Transcript_16776/g.33589  ORF Transcript_16776/g.33589 Transcript_16776/m.33589 type:complete len:252 (+) Transcript_16776:44-799(+)
MGSSPSHPADDCSVPHKFQIKPGNANVPFLVWHNRGDRLPTRRNAMFSGGLKLNGIKVQTRSSGDLPDHDFHILINPPSSQAITGLFLSSSILVCSGAGKGLLSAKVHPSVITLSEDAWSASASYTINEKLLGSVTVSGTAVTSPDGKDLKDVKAGYVLEHATVFVTPSPSEVKWESRNALDSWRRRWTVEVDGKEHLNCSFAKETMGNRCSTGVLPTAGAPPMTALESLLLGFLLSSFLHPCRFIETYRS